MKRNKLIISSIVGCAFTAILMLVIAALPMSNASAASSISVLQKAALSGLYDCYRSDAYSNSIDFANYYGLVSIVDNANATKIYLPNGTTTLKDNIVNCSTVLGGTNILHGWSAAESFSGLYSLAGKNVPTAESQPNEISSFLEGMGYDKTDESNGKCTEITYTWSDESPAIIRICASDLTGSDEIINVDEMTVTYTGGKKVLQVTPTSGQIVCTKASVSWWTIKFQDKNNTATINFEKGKTKWEDFAIAIREQKCAPDQVSYTYEDEYRTYRRKSVTDVSSDELTTKFTLPLYSINDAANKAIRFLSNNAVYNRQGLKLDASEKINLLQYYLDNYYKVDKRCGLSAVDAAQARSEGYRAATIVNNNTADSCYIKASEHRDDEVYIWDNSDYLGKNVTATYLEVLSLMSSLLDEDIKERCNTQLSAAAETEWFYAFKRANNPVVSDEERKRAEDYMAEIDALKESGQYWEEHDGIISCVALKTFEEGNDITVDTDYDGEISGDDYAGAETSDGCSLNAGALGWIICPVIQGLGEVASSMFATIADQYLSVSPDIIEDSAMSQAWGGFQTFANTVFVIFLLFVILSQVTGFGLSNYGIKKVLPRLIITALLVNLSFIICTIASDLSNITGSGLNELFANIKLSTTVDGANFGVFIRNTVTGIGATAIPIGAAAGALAITIADGGWGVLIMPILIGVIIAFFAILFFFVLLAVRKAAIIILIAVSPVAIVCYILPNTQKIFSKWLRMFSTLLLVYPICGILMGGGNFASRLLLLTAGESGFVYYLVCMLLSVIPFFLVPSILKNSMSALGSFGAKLANMGSRLSNMATGAVRRSRWAQDHQQEIARNIDMNRSKRIQARNQKVLDRLNRKRTNPNDASDLSGLSSKERKQYTQATLRNARATSTLDRRHKEEVEAANIAEYYTDEMLQNQEATARRKYRENTVASFADGTISSGKYHRSDGSAVDVDIDDPKDIEKALINLAQDVEDNPDDKLAKIRLESMMEVAKRKGAKGRRSIINAMHETEDQGRASAAKSMARALSLDDRSMGALHSYDSGSEAYVQDLVAGRPTKSKSDYAMQTIESLKLDNVGDMDDTFWDNLGELRKEINGLRNSSTLTPAQSTRLADLKQAYKKSVNITTQAAQDSRYAGKIKSKDAQNIINEHAKQMYEIERDDWLKNAANLSQLTVTGANGAVTQAAGIDGQGYLTNGTSRLVDASGNQVLATDAYSNQIKAYQDIALGQGSAELKIPRKRNVPYVFDNSTGNYRAENDAYVSSRQQWMGQQTNGQSNVTQLRGYDANSGQYVNASSVDAEGFLLNAAGNRMLDHAGGNALSANDAYDCRLYATQRSQWLSGTTNGQSNITQLRGYDGQGNWVNAASIDTQGFLVDAGGNRLRNSRNGVELRANDAYRNQIQKSTARFRDLRPEEQRVLDKILDYNASIDIQHGQ